MAPASAENWYNLAVALQEGGHGQEGGVAIREAIRRDSKRPEAHNTLGVAYTMEGKPKMAEEEFRATIALDPRNARAWNNLGNTLRDANRFDEARDAYQHAIALAPRYPDPLNGLGVIDVQQDRARDAIAEFDAALRIAPMFYEAQLNRGIALRLAGDRAAAAEQFRQLLAALPPDRDYDRQRDAARALLAR
jgi:Tfp pilus assembly protein PilF